ncbi:hypothetical protein [Alteromonas sp. CNT1-28]|uniref:hypothetical protein n=1 Tax=Alteromonas sp. CNT1-28 TaxID=2917730 RepID=UPI001EF20E52|nr:hypothetical protein [Alteromonas sp. CNT1-28]MCG7639615.1 hypothetical protein [Alteromonas sp. CNT1-28]
MVRFILFSIFLFIPFKSHANFGFGPCCSGYTCGIIPCDSSCAGKAFNSFGTKASQLLSSVNTSSKDLSLSEADVSASVAEMYSSLATSYQSNHESKITALDGVALKLELAQSGLSKSVSTFFEALVSEFVNALKSQSKLKAVHQNSNSFSEIGNPVFNELIIGTATDLKVALVDKQTFQFETSKKLNAFKNVTSKLHNSSKTKASLRKSIDSVSQDFDILSIIDDGQNIFANLQILEQAKPDKYSAHTNSYLVSNQIKNEAERSLSGYLNALSTAPLTEQALIGNTFKLSKSGLERQLIATNQLSNTLFKSYLETLKIRKNEQVEEIK